jgi:myo-inositol 2-dehydrogenase / D-chiro-inositol 1-dehydrogenase
MSNHKSKLTRRRFLQSTAVGVPVLTIVPRDVLGGPGSTPPSASFGGAVIGDRFRSNIIFSSLGPNVRRLAECDFSFKDRVDNRTIFTDYRRLLERKDIDLVAIATHAAWHATISIAAMEAGKDVFCDKPMTRFIAEGRKVVEAERRYKRIFQIGVYGRFGANKQLRKLMASGLLKECTAVVIQKGGFKIRAYSGKADSKPQPVPPNLDWDMYCGTAPLRPYSNDRYRTSCGRPGHWDYGGGGLVEMGSSHLDGFNYAYAKDYTSPVEIEGYAPPAHPEAVGMWGWCELRYADGLTLVLEGDEWGPKYDRKKARSVGPDDLSPEDREKLKTLPDPERLVDFATAIRTRKQPAEHAEAAHRTCTLAHLANIAIRTGRKLKYDPVKEEIIGDEEANRLVNEPMRAPWRV